jgi:outer membrane protein assembly factor BamB
MTKKNINHKIWHWIAYIAGGFSFIICILLIANFLQINRADPVNTQTIDLLVERLNQDPSDIELREQIREMDLLARKAYFTSQWQIKTGGYLLLIGLAVMIIAIQVIISNKKKEPEITNEKGEELLSSQQSARKWISISGAFVVGLALVFAFLSHQELGSKFQIAALDQEKALLENDNTVPEQIVEEENSSIRKTNDSIPEKEVKALIVDTIESLTEEIENKSENHEEADDIIIESTITAERFTAFRGEGGRGIATQKNIPTQWNGASGENILWKTAIPLPGFNSPIIWEDKIFLTGANEAKREVYAINRNSGEILWNTIIENVPGSPAKGPDVPDYTGHAAPTATTDGNHVYAIFANGDIVALDFNGNVVWSKNLGVPENHYGHSSSLLMYKDKVIVQYDQKNIKQLMALFAKNGETAWSTTRKVKVAWSSPVLIEYNGNPQIVLAAEPFVSAYDPETGNELWSLDCIYGEVGPSIAYADGRVFAMNDYAELVAIQLGDEPKIIWQNSDFLSDVPSPVATENYVFIPTSYGLVACYDAKSGELYWEKEFDNSIYASPIIAEGKVYLIDKQGIMHIFKADKKYISLGEPELGEKMVCTPAFSDSRIYLRGYDHLYCIGK